MNPPAELQAAHDEVLRKIGRNLLMFQQAEQLLKLLLTWGSFETTSADPAGFDDLADVWKKQTLGQLKARFVDKHCRQSDDPLAGFDPETAGLAMSFTLGGSDGYAECRSAAFDRLVVERNNLVHHLFPNLDRNSLQSCRDMSAYLDAQWENALPEIQQLREDCKRTREMMIEVISFLMSDDGILELQAGPIRQCPLITNLASIAAENPDPREWIPLGPATQLLQDFPSEKIDTLVAQFGLKSLAQLLEASQRFDIKVEQFEKGSRRIHYRLKAGSEASGHAPPDPLH